MKIRNGFISNSSTSSFVMAIRGDLSIENLINYIGMDENFAFYDIVREICEYIYKNAQKIGRTNKFIKEQFTKEMRKQKDINFYEFYASDGCDATSSIEPVIRLWGAFIESENLIIKGYEL